MCDPQLVVWTSLIYVLSLVYVVAYAGGYSNVPLCCVLYILLGVVLGLQVVSSCDMAFMKVGAALFGLMLFTWCGGITERCTTNPSI